MLVIALISVKRKIGLLGVSIQINLGLIAKISWRFSNITTTSMLIGGLSSSGFSSYQLISKEIKKALLRNNIKFSYLKVQLRGFWKIIGFLNKK